MASRYIALPTLGIVLIVLVSMVGIAGAEDKYIKFVFHGERPGKNAFIDYSIYESSGTGGDGYRDYRVAFLNIWFRHWFSVPLREYNPLYIMVFTNTGNEHGAVLRTYLGNGDGGSCYRWVLYLHLEATITGIWREHTRYYVYGPYGAGKFSRDLLAIGYHNEAREPLASGVAPILRFTWGNRSIDYRIPNTPSGEYYVYTVTDCSDKPVSIDFIHINESLHIATLVPPGDVARPAAPLPSDSTRLAAAAAAGLGLALFFIVFSSRKR